MVNETFFVRSTCPACRSPRRETVYRKSYQDPEIAGYLELFYGSQGRYEPHLLTGAQYVIDHCEDCGLVYQEEVPGDRLLHRLYEHWLDSSEALDRYKSTRRLDGVAWASHCLTEMHRHLGATPHQLRVLDFGMGWGDWCHLARAFGCEVYGMELSEPRRRHAREQGLEILTWAQAEEQAGSFDIVHSEQVFEHLTDPLDTLQRLTRLLRSGGLLYLSVPNGGDILRRLANPRWDAPKDSDDSLNAIAPLEHLNCFNKNSLIAMTSRAGLRPVTTLAPTPRMSRLRHLARAVQHLYRRIRGRSTTRRLFRKCTMETEL